MALIERIEKTTETTSWQDAIPLSYRYTAGRAGQRFFSHIEKKGQLLGARCEACGVTYVPPSIYCERCLARIEDCFVELEPRGTVHAVTVCHEGYVDTFNGGCDAIEEKFSAISLGETVCGEGGVYLAGGIPRRILPALERDEFLGAFRRKGRLSDLLEQIPVHVILNPKVSLLGAAYCGIES